MKNRRKVLYVLSFPDLDSVGSLFLHILLHFDNISRYLINWKIVRAGAKISDFDGDYSDYDIYHLDTGGQYDGIRFFDHHQSNDPRVQGECAMSLVAKSFEGFEGRDDYWFLQELVEFVQLADHAKTEEIRKRTRENKWSPWIQDLTTLHRVCRSRWGSASKKVDTGLNILDALYKDCVLRKKVKEEFLSGKNLQIIDTPAGKVLKGEIDISSRGLRGNVRSQIRGEVDFIVAKTGDGRIGITKVDEKNEISLRKVAQEVAKQVYGVPFPSPANIEVNSPNPFIYPGSEFCVYWYLNREFPSLDEIIEALVVIGQELSPEQKDSFYSALHSLQLHCANGLDEENS